MDDRNFDKPRLYIGGSDIATIAGKNRWKTPLMLFQDLQLAKNGEEGGFQGNDATRFGTDLEAYVISRYIEDTYDKQEAKGFLASRLEGIERYQVIVTHPNGNIDFSKTTYFHSWQEIKDEQHDFICVHPDCIVTCNGAQPYIIEAKCTSPYNKRGDNKYEGYDLKGDSGKGVP